MENKRKLGYIFFGLPYHVKTGIAVGLGLILESDKGLRELQQTQNYFKRAIDGNLLYELWNEVMMVTELNLDNPFLKPE